jgi:carbonic anhydrase
MRGRIGQRIALLLTLDLIVCAAVAAAAQGRQTTAAAQLQRLLDGNQRYVNGHPRHPGQRPTGATQTPFAAILSCADARVPPEIVFDQGVNDLFVVRVAGNTADDPAAAHPAVTDTVQLQSLAYAVQTLKVKLIVVMGHEHCGAVGGALQKCGQSAIGPMFQNICPAVNQVASSKAESGDRLASAIQANVDDQVKLLKATSPFKEMVDSNQLRIVGAVYAFDGKVAITAP